MTKCVVCESSTLKSHWGSVAPFVAYRIWGREAFSVKLLECRRCGFAFFSPRLEPEEEQRLYAGYRNEAYQKMRYTFEPWYTKRFHENLFCDATMQGRRESLKRLLSPYLNGVQVRAVLDFGGGRGELIADLVGGTERYVYDLSDAEALPGIKKLQSLADCKAQRYDLIVCSNVLEHVAYPREVLREMADVAAPGTLIFVEVPHECPFSYRERAKRVAQWLILLPTHPSLARSLAGRGMLSVMHEHVNFFSPGALERLMSSLGLEARANGEAGDDSLTGTKMLWSVARRTEAVAGSEYASYIRPAEHVPH